MFIVGIPRSGATLCEQILSAHRDVHGAGERHALAAESRVRTVSRAQVRQPVNAKGLGRWRRYEAELAPLIAELEAAGVLDAWRDPISPHH